MDRGPLKLRAEDAEDLAVMAAVLQDARAPLKEMVFDPEARRFLVALRRYRRECLPDPCAACDGLTETSCVLGFLDIEAVRHRGLDLGQPDKELSLLTIATEPGASCLVHIRLVFAGGAEIRLESDCIRAWLEDFGEPRPAPTPPAHPVLEEDS